MNKYLQFFLLELRNGMEYRLNFVTLAIVNFFPVIVNLFLWRAIFASNHALTNVVTVNQINGYVITIQIINLLIQPCSVEFKILGEIRGGDLSKHLLKPINYYSYNLMTALSQSTTYFLAFTAIGVVLWFVFRGILITENIIMLLLFIVSLFAAFVIRFTLSCLFGMLVFFLDDISQLFMLFSNTLLFLCGFLFPLSILPDSLLKICKLFPFYYIGYFPCSIFVGMEAGLQDVLQGILTSFIWIVILITIYNMMWDKGIKKYTAFGG